MRFARVADWLAWQQTLHPRIMDPGVERVASVGDSLGVLEPQSTVIVVAGTNGKGSTVAFLEGLAREAGYRPGSSVSPHIFAYNERIRIDGACVTDDMLLAAFDAVDRARGDTTLTFFEFGTLAALWCFRETGADPWVLEVGLGGRLDAVNAVSSDVAVVTSIAMDHADWLGNDLDTIAREKAGIMRQERPAICGQADPPTGLREAARERGARLSCRGSEFDVQPDGGAQWSWHGRREQLDGLLMPAWAGGLADNAAAALAAWEAASPPLTFPTAEQASRGLACAILRGRMERLADDWIIDVAHNPAAAGRLAAWVAEQDFPRPLRGVFAVMARKELAGIVAAMAPVVDIWHPLALDDEQARPVSDVTAAIEAAGGHMGAGGPPAQLLPQLGAYDGTKLVFGAFRAVEETMRWYAGEPTHRVSG